MFSLLCATLFYRVVGSMIYFVVVEDMEIWMSIICKIIDDFMMTNNFEYKIIQFDDYNEKFDQIMKSNLPNKFYILDIVTKTSLGTTVAKKIRKCDFISMINFITSYFEEYMIEIISNNYMFLSFINKNSDYKTQLEKAISLYLNTKDDNNILLFKTCGINFRVWIKNITTITFKERKSWIGQIYSSEYPVNLSLHEVFEKMNRNFIFCHKSCIVNLEQVVNIDTKNKIIYFSDGSYTTTISSLKMQEVIEKFNEYNNRITKL